MVFGMGFVIVFLTLLVFATSIMSKLASKYFPESPPQPATAKTVSTPTATNNQDEIVAVISAAVHKYRS